MRTINGLCVFGLLLSLVLIGGGTMAKADMLYSQPTDLNGGYFSQNDTAAGGSGNFATAYDNFTLSTTAAVKNVEWT